LATPLSAAAEIGKQMFFDKSLSGSGKQACELPRPAHAHAQANNLAVQLGGAEDDGRRARGAIAALQEYTPPYADMLDNPDGISTPGPGGGYTQDGRAATLAGKRAFRCWQSMKWPTRAWPMWSARSRRPLTPSSSARPSARSLRRQ
jgi:cytochrome c peroxidase